MPGPAAVNATQYGLDWQRALLDDARRELARAAVAQRAAEDRLRALARAAAPADADELRAARAAAKKASADRVNAAQRLRAETAVLGKDLVNHVDITPDAEIARLGADLPVVLLPVRLETRFAGSELLLRVYPDDIFGEAHEPELTDKEVTDGEAFWDAAWPGEDAERAAWKSLVDAAGAPRAAWIAQALTPTNIGGRPAGAPLFPAPARHAASWTRAATARLLPDRWLVLCYRNGLETHRKSGAPIIEPLALTIAPTTDASDRSPLTTDGLQIDDSVRWTIDFDDADKIGMGLRIDLSEDDRSLGFDRILVFGVKSSLTPERSAGELEDLFAQHRFDRGVAMVPQGTATNNSAAGPTAYPPADPDASTSFHVERQALTVNASQDGGRLMAALGLPLSSAGHMEGADRDSDGPEAAMARALWPVTLGYFLEQMMAPVFSDAAIDATQRFFVGYVRGRGPLPAFRIGNTPYGVLPVAALAPWQPAGNPDPLERELPGALRTLRPLWMEKIADVPRIGKSNDPDADLLAVLGMDASTREVRVRYVIGQDVQWNLFGMLGYGDSWREWLAIGQQLAAQLFALLGHPEWSPRIAGLNFGNSWPFGSPLVAEDPLSERDALAPNYIDWIAKASVPALNAEALPGGAAAPSALLYKLLRHAALLEYHEAAFKLRLHYGRLSEKDRRETELVGIQGTKSSPTRLERLGEPLPQVSGSYPLHYFLENPSNASMLRGLLPGGTVLDMRDALKVLASQPTAELHRLFGETLDVASHRLDAWVTALATKRLAEMRTRRAGGCHLGAFGWLEDLRPRPAGSAVKLPGGGVAYRQPGNGGYIHAPSMMHATTAAVLRNGYLSRSGPGQTPYAVDLSSARVRLGRFLLDAVREGQPIGAVLGYLVERGLHERGQDKFIAPFREIYPLVPKKKNDASDTSEPAEQIPVRNVVDGLALWRAYQKGAGVGGIPWGSQGLPAVGASAELENELKALDAAADSVSDLLLAESVYQLVKGSPSVASATLDAMAQGTVRPPDPEVAMQPRRGTPVTHRVAIVLGDGAAPLPAGWRAAPGLRALAEPNLDAWLGTLFGDPAQVVCNVQIGPAGAPPGNTPVKLSELGLRPVDVLALARSPAQKDPAARSAAASELDRRIQDKAYDTLGVATEVETRITYELPAAADRAATRSFGDILELARAVISVLAKSRPLAPADLVAEDGGAQEHPADLQPNGAIARATATYNALRDFLANEFGPALASAAAAPESPEFDLAALRNKLRSAALAGVSKAYPLTSRGNTLRARRDLVAQATSVKEEFVRRLAKAKGVLDDATLPAHAGHDAYRIRAAADAVSALLGADAVFLPAFTPAAPDELGNALGQVSQPAFIAATGAERARAVRRFEMVSSRVRPALDAWRRVELLATALGRAAAPRAVAQLPYEENARWVALPFAIETDRPKAGRTSILLHRAAAPAATGSWSGLLLDAWTELIPLPKEQTGVAFHYDDSGAEAPQTILVAVPPVPAEQWDLAALVATLNETLDLAKVRAVDSELLGKLGQVLPAIYLADATDDVTVRTSFLGALRREANVRLGAQTGE
jgi:hypothetical protein